MMMGTQRPTSEGAAGNSILDRPLFGVLAVNWEVVLYGVLVLAAGVTRFWDLGGRAIHFDESQHATFSWYLFTGRGYQQHPVTHGPFQFHLMALTYFLFGVNDFAARIGPALFGTALVALPYFLRHHLGRWGGLTASLLLLISPSIMYFSRFARNEVYLSVWAMLMVISLFGYMRKRRPFFLYLGSAALSLSFADKAVTHITIATFLAFLSLVTGREVVGKMIRQRFDLSELSGPAVFLVLWGTLALPQFSAGAVVVRRLLRLDLSSPVVFLGLSVTQETLMAWIVVLALFALSVCIGVRWNARLWLTCFVIFYLIYIPLYTTFFTNLPGFASGLWSLLAYWLSQQAVQRGAQPPYYYPMLLGIYEFLPVALFLVGAAYGVIKRRLFTGFLLLWAVTASVAYTYAGERMPWLVVHITLPIILLAGAFLGRRLEAIDWGRWWRAGGLIFAGLLLLVPFLLRAQTQVFGEGLRGQPVQQALAISLFTVLTIGLLVVYGRRLGWGGSAQTAGLTMLAVMLVFTVRAAWQTSYSHREEPVEALVYSQGAPEIAQTAAKIDAYALRSGQGKELRITVDATHNGGWPWPWYLRNYPTDYPNLSQMSGPPSGSVLILAASNEAGAKPFLAKYGPGERIRTIFWFPENYRGLTWRSFLRDLVSSANWRRWWAYFMHRELPMFRGGGDAIVYFPKDALGVAAPPARDERQEEYAKKQTPLKSELSFGHKGTAPGSFNQPTGIAMGPQGDVYVVDSLNHRVQRFNAAGQLVDQVGRQGKGDGEFNEPWGVAIDAQGNVYVADTWNHRIQRFTADLRFVGKWGEFFNSASMPQGGEGRFYGPRGMAVDDQGNVYVTDTGNKRVQKFDREGKFLASFGGAGNEAGRFSEPVGIQVDKGGNIYVADTWNRRIQILDQAFKPLAQFPIYGWESQGVLNKPFLALEDGGNFIVVSDPENHRLLRFARDGTLAAVMGRFGTETSALNLPLGLAVDAIGKLWVAEGANHRVRRLAR